MGQITVSWIEQHRYLGIDSTAHSVVLSPPNDIGIKPSDALLIALASCTAHDIVEIIAKQRLTLERLVITATGEQAAEPPWAYQQIHLNYAIKAPGLGAAQAERAVNLALNSYCSVRASLSADIAVTFEISLID
ncbi:MAG: OsmC family protein [Chloroflexaceae bacterium]|nr:OsmC family protein [Chloroflexaceae bacterium]